MYKEVKGDIFENMHNFDVLIHGCNCFCTMGAGIAKIIKQKFPSAYDADCSTIKGDKDKLGSFTVVYDLNHDVEIVNAYTQYHYNSNNTDLFDYEAWTSICRQLNRIYRNGIVAMPKIGAGLAGGDWSKISEIVKDNITDADVTIYYL